MITKPTHIFAPDEMPSTNGPAMGLRKNVCSRKPETASAPPSTAAVKRRGRRMLQMILLSTLPSSMRRKIILNIFTTGILTEPVFTLSTMPSATSASNARNTS